MAVSPKSTKLTLQELPRFLDVVLTDREKRAREEWSKLGKELAKRLIDESIGKGVSPVKNGGASTGGRSRYKQYSETYKEKIKRYYRSRHGKKARPVNLKLSGDMRKSIKSRVTRGGFYIWYQDKKADYHNQKGAGKSKVIRQMLPYRGQQFSRTITSQLQDLYVDLFNKIK